MNEPRCIAQLLRNESPRAIDFTITHGSGAVTAARSLCGADRPGKRNQR